MRILNVNALLDANTGGGTAERTFQLSRALSAQGAQTAILTLDIGITDDRRCELEDIKIVALPCLQSRFLVPRFTFSGLTALVESTDVVHISGHWTPLNALVYLAASRVGKPHVVCPAGALNVFGRSKLIKRMFNAAIGYRLVRRASAWVAITAAERTQFALYGVEPERVTVIPNGVRIEQFGQHDEVGFRSRFGMDNHPLILFMGRLSPIKGPDILLEAFAQLGTDFSSYHLVFAGVDEGLRDSLQQRASQTGIGARVHFVGHLSGLDKASAYHAADLLVVPSRQEAMSIVALEAGACGRPVLITDQCGFDEVEHVGGGRIVKPCPQALAMALAEMLASQDALIAMGRKLSALVAERYTWEAAARRYMQLFSGLLCPAS